MMNIENDMRLKKYRITLNEHQLRLISACVEDCHRFAGGQVELENTTCMLENHHEIQERLKEVYPLVVPELYRQYGRNASYGWNGGSCPNEHQRKFLAETYYIYREILHQLTIRDDKDDWSVYNGSTLTCAESGEPIIIEDI